MSRNRKGRSGPGSSYRFAIAWVLMSILLPMYRTWGLLVSLAVACAASFLLGRRSGQQEKTAQEKAPPVKAQPRQEARTADASANKKSYGPEVDAILQESNRALSEMGRIYMSIKDPDIRRKINEIMRITDKIAQDAIADPADIPQIKKFFNYYLPTTIKLLNSYDRMSAQGIEGENLDKSMNSINEMLDTAIVAYKKRLDSLFENQALDIETDIQVMNTMLAREGLTGEKDFIVEQQ